MFRGLAQRTPFYYGWVVAGAVLMAMMISGAVSAPMFSVFIPRWTEEFGWSRTAISGAFSFGTIAAALVGPLVGRALDKYGGRLVMGGGALLMAAAVAGMGFVENLVGLYAALVVARTALMSIQNLGGHTVIANWFVRRRAFATAIAVNGSRLGLGLWPLLGAALIAALGWREAVWVIGGLMALLALFPLVAIVSRQPGGRGAVPGRTPSGDRAGRTGATAVGGASMAPPGKRYGPRHSGCCCSRTGARWWRAVATACTASRSSSTGGSLRAGWGRC